MTNFYQVFVRRDLAPGWELLLSDLDAKQLHSKFVRPYEKGERILVEGHTIDFDKIQRVKIVRTSEPKATIEARLEQDYYHSLERNNRTPGMMVLGLPPNEGDIADAGEDLTAEFIKGPAGNKSGPGIIRVVLEHPVISGVIGSVIAALILWLAFGLGD